MATSAESAAVERVDRRLAELDQFGIKLGLEGISRLLEELGRPQDRIPSVIVAGTNGKGSVSSLLAAMARSAGYRAGLYTSPHLERPEERIRVDGVAIPSALLADLLDEVIEVHRRALDRLPSYFEALTAAARLHFARSGVDLAVVEVGLGGRLDATNVGEPELAVITPIGWDHKEHLGNTLRAIALEKAGVLRPGGRLVTWAAPEEVAVALTERARELGVELLDARSLSSGLTLSEPGEERHRIEVETPRRRYSLSLALSGQHQSVNARIAVLAAETLAEQGWQRLDRSAIEIGAERCRWPGRLEQVLLPGGTRVLLDGAHNPDGALALCHHLEALAEPFDLLFGALAKKEVDAMLPPLASHARRVLLSAPSDGRAYPPERLRDHLGDCRAPVEVAVPASRALERALAESSGFLVVAGSLYLVGELRARLNQLYGVPVPAREMVVG